MKIRKIALIFAAVAALLTLPLTVLGKTASGNTPAAAVKTFWTAMSKADFATAKNLVQTKELVGLIKFVEDIVKANPDFKSEACAEFKSMAAGKSVSQKISGDTAEVVWEYKDGKKTKKDTFKLKKISGTWKLIE